MREIQGVSEKDLEKFLVTYNEIKKIFLKYKEKFFTQRMFVEGLEKSNPYINKLLRKLVEEEVISFRQVGRTKFYKLR